MILEVSWSLSWSILEFLDGVSWSFNSFLSSYLQKMLVELPAFLLCCDHLHSLHLVNMGGNVSSKFGELQGTFLSIRPVLNNLIYTLRQSNFIWHVTSFFLLTLFWTESLEKNENPEPKTRQTEVVMRNLAITKTNFHEF